MSGPKTAPAPEVVVLRHARAKWSRDPRGRVVVELPARLTREQELDAQGRRGSIVPIHK